MYLKKVAVVAVAALAVALGACGTTKEQQGTVIGAVAGGVLGTQIGEGSGKLAATIAGTLLGGFIGGNIGREMDENDRYRAGQVLENTPTNQSSTWQNPDSGTSYSVTPTRTYYEGSQPCREYTTDAWIDGRKETIYGTACRQPDGTWKTAN